MSEPVLDCVLLAAGYATRLYPLTRDMPKPLLPVAGRTILDRLVDNALGVPRLGRIAVAVNARFADRFEDWRRGRPEASRIVLVNDGSTDNDNRIGALNDLALALRTTGMAGPALVLAGDNLFEFPLADFARFHGERGADCITTHRQDSLPALRRTGVIEMEDDGRVTAFQEKPEHPRTRWAVPPLYLFTADTLGGDLPRYLSGGGDADAPGSFIPWLIGRKPVYAFRFDGPRYDIGTPESYRDVRLAFGEVLSPEEAGDRIRP